MITTDGRFKLIVSLLLFNAVLAFTTSGLQTKKILKSNNQTRINTVLLAVALSVIGLKNKSD